MRVFLCKYILDNLIYLWYYQNMKRDAERIKESEKRISIADFLASFNKNMPKGFPLVTPALLKKFQTAHAALFKDGNTTWSLDQHRKKLIDWLPRNIEPTDK